MPSTYFKNFNIINYGSANTPAVDLTERVVLNKSSQYHPYDFYPLDISEGTRPDIIAQSAWSDPYASWVLYMTNGIVDPYYDYFLNPEEFYNFITLKYGSIQKAKQTILYYRTDWSNSPNIPINAYNALSANQKKYYQPNYNNTYSIVDYARQTEDIHITTNMVVSLSISGNTIAFQSGEPVNISYVAGSTGTAQTLACTNGTIVIQHCEGDSYIYPTNPNNSVIISNSSVVTGVWSGANAQITSSTVVSQNLQFDEMVFWSQLSAYDYEYEKNTGNRVVNVLKPTLVSSFINNTANLLSQVIA